MRPPIAAAARIYLRFRIANLHCERPLSQTYYADNFRLLRTVRIKFEVGVVCGRNYQGTEYLIYLATRRKTNNVKWLRHLRSPWKTPELVKLASELIERNSGPFNPKRFKNTYAEEVLKLVEKNQGPKDRDSKDRQAQVQQCRQSHGCPEKEPQGRRGKKPAKPARKRKSARS